jgi:hypothetical protein
LKHTVIEKKTERLLRKKLYIVFVLPLQFLNLNKVGHLDQEFLKHKKYDSNKKYAAIDIGSNVMRLLINIVEQDGKEPHLIKAPL